jgi:DNA-binding LytR/AlgR family response regulator
MEYDGGNILIVEDNMHEQRMIQHIIHSVNERAIFHVSDTTENALKIAYDIDIDIFILDIQLAEGSSGIVLAKKIRKIPQYFDTPIIFATSFGNKELNVFRGVRCQTFIIKPLKKDLIEKAYYTAEKAIKSRSLSKELSQRKDKKSLSLTYKGLTHKFFLEDIVLFKSKGNHILVIIYDDKKNMLEIIEKIETIKNIVSKLNEIGEGNFVRCHKCYLVNQQYVSQTDWRNGKIMLKFNKNQTLDQSIWYDKLDDTLCIPIGNSYKANFQKEYI